MDLFSVVDTGIEKKYYILGTLVFKKNLISVFYRKHKKLFKNYNNIYILNSNIGEAYLVFRYFAKNLIKNKTLFVATKKYHVDIIKMFFPACEYVLEEKINLDQFCSKFTFDNKEFTVLFNHSYYVELEKDMRNLKPRAHYYTRMQEFFNCLSNMTTTDDKLNNITSELFEQKLKNIRLNLDNFVFIAPEANSCLDIDDGLLKQINSRLNEKGFDVFWNLTKKHDDFKDYKTCFLSLIEALYLCSKAKAIISVRSGLAEFLSEADVPMYIFYSKLKNRAQYEQMSAKKVLNGFTLSKLPNYRDNIKEYIADSEDDYKKFFDEILVELCKKM